MMEMHENNVLIDPSLMLAENSIANTFDLIKELGKSGEKFRFYYPQAFRRLISKPESSKETPGIKFFLHGAYPSDPKELNAFLEQFSYIISEFIPTPEQIEKYSFTYDTLSKELEYRGELYDRELLDILFEEWIFLQEYSWVVSRIKKPFNRLVAAGAVCIQFSRRTVDILINRTLRREHDEFISNVDRLRAFGKWIAVGGAAAASRLIIPDISGITVPAVIGILMLIDPETMTLSCNSATAIAKQNENS